MRLKVIITGATGMVGEGVLFECLQNENVNQVLIVNRRPYDLEHPKLKQLIVPDFSKLQDHKAELEGFDACFFCAGVSSVGMNEQKYRQITYDMTLSFAKTLVEINPDMVFTYVSGSHTDSTENGRVMWARVKGKTENDLMRLGFKAVYNFRPGVMYPTDGQKNWKALYKWITKGIRLVAPKSVLDISEVGKAMVNAVVLGYTKPVLEVADIRYLASGYSHQQLS